jgi:hypothetical protein
MTLFDLRNQFKMNFIFKKILSYESLVALLIFCFSIIAPITTDDGWNFLIFDNYLKTGDLVLLGFDINANFSRIVYILQANLLNYVNYSLSQFIYIFLFALIGFYAVCQLVRFHFSGAEKILYFTFYILFFFSTFYILKTRPEAVYVNLLFVIIYILSINLNQKISAFNLILISFILAFSVSSHPNGAFGLIIIAIYFFESKKTLPGFFISIGAFSTFILFTFLFTFYNISFSDFTGSVKKLSGDAGHSVPFYKEYIRYIYFYSNNKILFLLLLPLMFIGIKYRSSLGSHFINLFKTNVYFRFSIKCLFSGLFFLFINPAKWDTYLVLILLFVIDLIIFLSLVLSKKDLYLFITFSSILILLSWMNSFKINEASVYNRLFNQRSFDALNKQCIELVNSKNIVFVQHGVYPLFRSYSKVDIFWQISNEFDSNIPSFANKNLDKYESSKEKFSIVTEQRNLSDYYNVRMSDSLKFNSKMYFIYSN